MGLQLLDGTTAACDFTTGVRATFGGTPATAVSWQGVAGYISLDITRDMFEQTVFSGVGWRSRIPGNRQINGRLDGFASKGKSISDPLALFANNFAVAFVATVDASCTLSFDGFASRHHTGIRAAGPSEMGLDFESAGVATSSWVVV